MTSPLEIVSTSGSRALISPIGAELISLKTDAGKEILYQKDGGWDRQSPLLFPVVGQIQNGGYEIDGTHYPMEIHGFLRDLNLSIIEHTSNKIVLEVTENNKTLLSYPFKFHVSVSYEFVGATLVVCTKATNTDDRTAPFSFGYHPGFIWPLDPYTAKEDHVITFEKDEPKLINDVLNWHGGGSITSPVSDRRLNLSDELFTRFLTVVLDKPNSTSVTYGTGTDSGPSIMVDFENLPLLAFWSRPGGNWVCIEPWDGHADPKGFTGSLWDKPRIKKVPPGETHDWTMRITYNAGTSPA